MDWHKKVSYIKSGVRIFAYFLLFWTAPYAAGALFLAELLGIAEEFDTDD